MGYHDRDLEQTELPVASMPRPAFGRPMDIVLRGCGLLLLFVGLALSLFALYQAWALYDEPGRIERFAVAVERGSNIDKVLTPRRPASPLLADEEGGGNEAASVAPRLRLSYFFAWFVAGALLLIGGTLGFWAIATGGSLAQGSALRAR